MDALDKDDVIIFGLYSMRIWVAYDYIQEGTNPPVP